MNRRAEILLHLERRLSADLDTLMSLLGVGAKTIANDVAELNAMLRSAATVRLDGGKYRLWVIDRERYARIRAELADDSASFNDPNTRMGYILGALVRADGPIPTDEFARDMSVGRSTALGDVMTLRERMAPYGLEIKGRPNAGLRIVGDELSLRTFILEQHYPALYSGYPIDKELLVPLTKAVEEFHLGIQAVEDVYRWYTVMIDRMLTHHPIGEMPEIYQAVKDLPAYEFGQQVVVDLAERLQVTISPDEAVFLSLPVVGMHTPHDNRRLLRFPDTGQTDELLRQILDAINDEMGIRISPSAMSKEFAYHLSFLVNRLRLHVPLLKVEAADLSEAFPVAHRMALITSRTIKSRLDLVVEGEELQLLTSYFQVFIEEHRTMTQRHYRVAVVTSVGRISARLVQLQLQKVMAESTQYTLLSLDEAQPEVLDTFDLIVTTTMEPLVTKAPKIRLAEVFDREELVFHLNQLRIDPHIPDFLGAGSRSLLATMLSQDRFMRLDPRLSYRENLSVMLDRLIEVGDVDEKFREDIARREAQATMQIGTHVAFPHATLSGTEIVLAIGVIPRPAEEEGERLIVLLGVPEKASYDDTILVDIYEELLRLAGDLPSLEQISRFTSYEEFFMYMTNSTHREG